MFGDVLDDIWMKISEDGKCYEWGFFYWSRTVENAKATMSCKYLFKK